MPESFPEKLEFALKFLSVSRARLAADLDVDKSVVGRWLNGAVKPSAHNLSRLTCLIGRRVSGFTTLDWERDLDSLAELLGVDPDVVKCARRSTAPMGLPLPALERARAATKMRGPSYEGFFRSTRPFAAHPGRFVHDHAMIRRDTAGYLRYSMGNGGTFVDAWILPLDNQIYCIGSETTSGSLVFGIFNGSAALKVTALDGIMMTAIFDAGRTPTATAMVFERIGDLTGDVEADDREFAAIAQRDPMAPEGSVPEALRAHLVRDIGPAQLALGGDWLLRMPVARSITC